MIKIIFHSNQLRLVNAALENGIFSEIPIGTKTTTIALKSLCR